MGILWRLLAPKPVKRARRSVRKVTHPVHTITRAATPKPVKRLQRAAHPLSLAELKAEDAVVKALQGKRKRAPRKRAPARRPTPGISTARPARAAPHPQALARTGNDAGHGLRSDQRQSKIAARYGRRQAEAPAREAAYRAHDAARGRRRAARKEARGPWRWPEWTLAAALAAFVAFCVLAAATGKHMPTAAGVPLFLAWALGGLIGVPAVLWRWYRARQATAAVLGAPQHQADSRAPSPGTQS